MRYPIILIAGALLLTGAPRTVNAQTIRGCVQKSSQQVRIIDNADSCKQTEVQVTWNAAGGAEPMQSVTFQPGWAHYSVWSGGDTSYEDVRFFKDLSGVVHLQGLAGNQAGNHWQPTGGAAQHLFTLPAGYRPARALVVSASGNCAPASTEMDSICRLTITPDGKVFLDDPWFPSLISFTSLTFRVQ
jgi:hypothetical protein